MVAMKQSFDRRRIAVYLALGLYALTTARALAKPLVLDETLFPVEGQQAAYFGSSIDHNPPLLNGTVRLLIRHFGWLDGSLRWITILSFLLTLILTWGFAQQLRPGSGWLAALVVLLHPLAVQSSWTLDYDQAVMMPVLIGFCSLYSVLEKSKQTNRVFWLGAALALALWGKLTTPLAIPLAVGLAFSLRGKPVQGFALALRVSGVAFALFGFAWWVYSATQGLPIWALFHGRLAEVLQRGAHHYTLTIFQEIVERFVRVSLWMGPWFLVWVAWAALAHWRRPLSSRAMVEDIAWVLAAGVFTTYLVIGGVLWSFAKYHAPLIPLLAALGAAAVYRLEAKLAATAGKKQRGLAVMLLVGAIAYWFAGDLLYAVNHTLRDTLLFDRPHLPQALQRASVQLALLLMGGFVIILGIVRGQKKYPGLVGASLLIAAFLANATLLARQVTAPYSTAYCYGRPWKHYALMVRTAKAVAADHPQLRIMAPFDVLYGAGLSWRKHLWEWKINQTPEQFIAAVTQPDVCALIVDPYFSNAHFLSVILKDQRVESVLHEHFRAQLLGEATVWIRDDLALAP